MARCNFEMALRGTGRLVLRARACHSASEPAEAAGPLPTTAFSAHWFKFKFKFKLKFKVGPSRLLCLGSGRRVPIIEIFELEDPSLYWTRSGPAAPGLRRPVTTSTRGALTTVVCTANKASCDAQQGRPLKLKPVHAACGSNLKL